MTAGLREGVEAALKLLGSALLAHPANAPLRDRLHAGPEAVDAFAGELSRVVFRLLALLASGRAAATLRGAEARALAAPAGLVLLPGARLPEGVLPEVVHCLAAPLEAEPNFIPEALGSVYEALLNRRPVLRWESEPPAFDLELGGERKATGSYYTSPELVEDLVECTLGPEVQARLSGRKTPAEKERELLSLRVCDPACGTGPFLLGAARRIGRELARLRTGSEEPSPAEVRRGVCDAVTWCLYGVDVDPMAVALCRASLWLEAGGVGEPLAFLDTRIRLGNALVGYLPESGEPTEGLPSRVPDAAFGAVPGDDRKVAGAAKGRHAPTPTVVPGLHEEGWHPDPRPTLDFWTAAFFWPLDIPSAWVPTDPVYRAWISGETPLPNPERDRIEALAREHRFFHWGLEFPEVFAPTEEAPPGFDVVLANPPWGGHLDPHARKLAGYRMGRRPRGFDTYEAFVHLALTLCRPGGRVGLVLPEIVLLKDYPEIREHLLTHSILARVVEWGLVFPDAAMGAVSLTLVKEPPADHTRTLFMGVAPGGRGLVEMAKVHQALFLSQPGCRIVRTLSDDFVALWADLHRAGAALGEVARIQEGIHSGNARRQLFPRQPAREGGKLLLRRREWEGWEVAWEGHYFDLDAYRRLESPLYANAGWLEAYERPRLFLPRTSSEIRALYTPEPYFASNNFFVLTSREGEDLERLALLFVYLNSGFPTALHRQRYPRSDRLFPEVKIQHLTDLPVPRELLKAGPAYAARCLSLMQDAAKGRLPEGRVRKDCCLLLRQVVDPALWSRVEGVLGESVAWTP